MDIFLIGIIVVACLILFGAFCVATKDRSDGCLPLVLLGLLMLGAIFVLALLR